MRLIITVLLTLVTLSSFASTFPSDTHYEVCFTPGRQCTHLLVNTINKAKKSIYVQAYSFTAYAIAKALVQAKRRGIQVEVILDQSNFKPGQRTVAPYLLRNDIACWNDNTVSIAHNKVMIIDNNTVETGSFNFTNAAQYYNAENILIIHDSHLAKLYLNNWLNRQHHAHRITQMPH